ncbi:MAG: hypothetical protein EA397_18280 [Deltaproteobacteria bacterium]|nr:MAG: hypothetical protein EA397_18280 [Deltaproteobacteria bacterium]
MKNTELDPEVVEQIVSALAQSNEQKSREIAEAIGVDYDVVRAHLIELEQRGITYRTGRTRGTRWWLG